MIKFLIIMVAIFASNLWAQKVQYKASKYLQSEVERALSILPADYLQSETGRILIQEVPFKSDTKMSHNLCELEGVTFGETKKKTISISSHLVKLAQTDKRTFDCSHGSFKKLLLAVIIHELTHIKDNVEKISLEPDFQRIVGMKKVQRSSKKKLMSRNSDVSPDAYEFKNLEESLAVNVEYFVLDDEFECRRPATANFLSNRLKIKLRGQCTKNSKVMIQSAYLEDNYLLAADLNPSRIYQIHYLFAGKGKAMMSRWGHAMFRLVVCAPFRTTVGPECLDDVSHHLVLSYRATMSDMNVSYTAGLLGKYPSQLFIMRYLEIQQEYTKFDLRDLFSVPLKMTISQKEEFIDLTLERYWTYQGKYYFLDNNCGTESQKHLAVVLTDEQSALVHSITPHKLYKDIVKAGNELTENRVDGLSRDQMIERRYLIESISEELTDVYHFLKKIIPLFKSKSLDSFLKQTTAEKRLIAYQKLIKELDSSTDEKLSKKIVMKVVYFERYLASRFLKELPEKIFERMKKDKNLMSEVMKMGEGLSTLQVQPWDIVGSGYGIPVQAEFDDSYESFLIERQKLLEESIEGQMIDLQKILGKKYFARELNEVEVLKQNKALINELIKRINNF